MKPGNHGLDNRRRTGELDFDGPAAETDTPTLKSTRELGDAVNHCRRCGLWQAATQGVPGEGKTPNDVMLVGEAPGDSEDIQGHPFVGPAGAVLDRALEEAGLDRKSVYVTNAVKHFKFEPRGKRRLHAKPNAGEIKACNGWLAEEMRLVAPKLVIALGATAARAVLGRVVTITKTRGSAIQLNDKMHAWVTIHPSMLLRMPDEHERRKEYSRFVGDLKSSLAWLSKH